MIPRLLHRIWLGDAPIPEEYARFWDAWREMHPGWELRTHTGAEVKNRRLFDGLSTLSAKSDLLRYEIMRDEGGVYVDTDFEPLRPLDPLIDLGLRFFAGWEDDKRVCTALFGAVPEHPALRALVRDLPTWAARNRRYTPDIQTGPVFFTHTLSGRPDVTLFPPETFYPVSYWDRTRIDEMRPTLPAMAFALHHWGRSWMPKEKRDEDDARIEAKRRRVAILVPRKKDGGHRDAVWHWLKRRWQANFPDAIIAEGHCHDEFHRAVGVNKAARAAALQGADVFVIIDADVWCDPAATRRCIDEVEDYLLPWSTVYKLDEAPTRHLLEQEPNDVRLTAAWVRANTSAKPHTHLSGVLVVTREAFLEAGGLDERFRGWGFEDTAFIYRLDAVAGRDVSRKRGSANLIHLWHEDAPDRGNPSRESESLFNVYRASRGLPPWRRGIDA